MARIARDTHVDLKYNQKVREVKSEKSTIKKPKQKIILKPSKVGCKEATLE